MIQGIMKLLLGKVLGSAETKRRVIEGLREQAKKTDNKFDDAGVDAFEAFWDVAVPIIIGKISN